VVVSTQPPPQALRPTVQKQLPASQPAPAGHALSHSPQLLASVDTLAQLPPHIISLAAQPVAGSTGPWGVGLEGVLLCGVPAEGLPGIGGLEDPSGVVDIDPLGPGETESVAASVLASPAQP
jgi:hypothetical protein